MSLVPGFQSVRLVPSYPYLSLTLNHVLRSVLYGFSLAYLFAPSTFSSANIIEFAAGLPDWVKVVEKTVLAAPFAFHSLNGLRHLAWDTGKCLFPVGFVCNEIKLTF